MTLIASDGYEYKDLAARIVGKPLENVRNQQVVSYRYHKRPEGFIRAFCEAFDRAAAAAVSTHEARERGIRAAYSWSDRLNPHYPAP